MGGRTPSCFSTGVGGVGSPRMTPASQGSQRSSRTQWVRRRPLRDGIAPQWDSPKSFEPTHRRFFWRGRCGLVRYRLGRRGRRSAPAMEYRPRRADRRPRWRVALRRAEHPHTLGEVSYEDLPRYCGDFDVAIIPWLLNEL